MIKTKQDFAETGNEVKLAFFDCYNKFISKKKSNYFDCEKIKKYISKKITKLKYVSVIELKYPNDHVEINIYFDEYFTEAHQDTTHIVTITFLDGSARNLKRSKTLNKMLE